MDRQGFCFSRICDNRLELPIDIMHYLIIIHSVPGVAIEKCILVGL